MFSKLRKLLSLISPEQRKKFVVLQILVIITALFELIGIASIAPFMILVSDFSVLEGNNILAYIYLVSGFSSHFNFTFSIGILVLLLLIIGSLISFYTTWTLSIFGQEIGAKMGNRLFEYYLNKSWLFHTSSSSSKLMKQITVEANRITNGVITPFMLLNSKLITAIFISIALFVFNPLVTISALIIFGFSYFLIFRLVRYRLSRNGMIVSASAKERFKIMSEGFGGIRDILLSRSQKSYIEKFVKTSDAYANHHGETLALAYAPRYIMESIVFGSLISFLLYLMYKHNANFSTILPVLSVYTLASFKLVPALQSVYASLVLIRGNIGSFSLIENDLEDSYSFHISNTLKKKKRLKIKKSITLNSIHFTYPKNNKPTIKDINISIPINKTIGIAGPSGSGKSTIIDILVGLLEPEKGEILVDKTILASKDIERLQNDIGYVSQAIFLSDATILENIAPGVSLQAIDLSKANRAINLACLDKVIAELPNGIKTVVGERGVQLSGGQRQRIGIARALYNDPSILVFDEATSALDMNTEEAIMSEILSLSGQKTIIMIAHRLSTLKNCDLIYFIDKGSVDDSGDYKMLMKKNKKFKKIENLIS